MEYTEIDAGRTDALKDFYYLVFPYMEEHYPRVNKRQIQQYLKINGIRGFLKKYKIPFSSKEKKQIQEMMIEENNMIKQSSSPFLNFLQRRFDFYNKKFFRSRLTQIPFIITNKLVNNNALAGFLYQEGSKQIRYAEYKFHKKIFKSKSLTEIILLHEMCHHAVFELDKKLFTKATAHDSLWRKYMKIVGLVPPEDFQEVIINFEDIPNWESMSGFQLFKTMKALKNKSNRIKELKRRNKEYAIQELMEMFNPSLKILYQKYKKAGKINSFSELKNIFISKLNKSISSVFKYFSDDIQEQLENNRQVKRILIAESKNWNVISLYPALDKELGFK